MDSRSAQWLVPFLIVSRRTRIIASATSMHLASRDLSVSCKTAAYSFCHRAILEEILDLISPPSCQREFSLKVRVVICNTGFPVERPKRDYVNQKGTKDYSLQNSHPTLTLSSQATIWRLQCPQHDCASSRTIAGQASQPGCG